jgi:hypothetical protein
LISSALIARPSLIPAHPAAPSSVGRSKVFTEVSLDSNPI